MARKTIVVDDLTDQIISGNPINLRITVQVIDDNGSVVKAQTATKDFEVGTYTVETFAALVKAEIGLGEFMRRFKSLVKIPSGATGSTDDDENVKIRTWARENGHDINERGRIPADVREAYDKAMNAETE